jgi:CDP-diacylglycerol---glycerol-3-phosphate 3-phosphatidyltransferase
MRISNKFTLARVLLAPVFFVLYFFPIWTGKFAEVSSYLMFPLLIFMEFTDFLDGHFARKYHIVSDFGKLFDPFADVVVHLTTFTCFMFSYNPYFGMVGAYMPPFIFILIVYREFSMAFLRMIVAKKGTAIAARRGGKIKTVMYVSAGFFALLLETFVRSSFPIHCLPLLHRVSFFLFLGCLVCSYASFVDYLAHFIYILKDLAQ